MNEQTTKAVETNVQPAATEEKVEVTIPVTDIKIDEEKMKMGWKIMNKFKNANKFIQMQISNSWIGEKEEYYNKWIDTKNEIYNHLDNYDIDKANELLYHFFWDILCSEWIEESKKDPISITLDKIIKEIEQIIGFFYIK